MLQMNTVLFCLQECERDLTALQDHVVDLTSDAKKLLSRSDLTAAQQEEIVQTEENLLPDINQKVILDTQANEELKKEL